MLAGEKELKNLKLNSIKVNDLKILAKKNNLNASGNGGDLIKELINLSSEKINDFIRERYSNQIEERRNKISDAELIKQVEKVINLNWGVVQGQLDQKIQNEYVRKFFYYEDLINGVESKLHNDITSYVVATWYNHWTTVLIEDHISLHPKVVPTLKNNFGVDIFFDNQPFDLKTTYLPKEYPIEDAISNPKKLAIWMYENQGEQRFGYDNRLFVVLVDKQNPENNLFLILHPCYLQPAILF